MEKTIRLISRYDEAVELLPYHLRGQARLIDEMDKANAEEFRLRMGHVPSILLPEGERPMARTPVTAQDLSAVLEIASLASVHTVRDSLKQGYISAKGGFRVGLGGQASVRDGEVTGFLHLGSAAIRITKEIRGVADALLPQLKERGHILSTLILSPPGGGKTTVLRDLIRLASDSGRRVSLADERGEIAALKDGAPQMDVGSRTDVLTGCTKDRAVMMLLRTMNPEIIAMDEITAEEDARALERAASCGVTLFATVHGYDLDSLLKKPLYRGMIEKGLFERLVIISREASSRAYVVKEIGASLCSA